MASSVADADMSATEYDLRIHDGEVTSLFRLRDSGISLVGKEIEWRIDGVTRRAALSDIQAIRLTTAEETARGPLGTTTCQIRFRGGGAVTVFGGNSESPDAADRRACYETFVAELHRRLGPQERARIRFIAGYGGARFYFLLVMVVLWTLIWITAVALALLGLAPLRIRTVTALVLGAVMTPGLFHLLQLNAPHIYDPRSPIGSARAGSIGDTFGHAIHEIRRGMTLARGLTAAAIGAMMFMILVVLVAAHQRVSLFEPGRAVMAFDAVLARTGPARGVQRKGIDRSLRVFTFAACPLSLPA